MENIGRLGIVKPHTVTTTTPPKEKIDLKNLQKVFETLGDVQPTYKSLAKKAEKTFSKRNFKHLNPSDFKHTIKGPPTYIASNRSS